MRGKGERVARLGKRGERVGGGSGGTRFRARGSEEEDTLT